LKKKPDSEDKKEKIELLVLWECPNCGQRHFGDYPPDMCDYCHDFTTWRRIAERHDDDDQPKKRPPHSKD
jgi:rubrerythrin